jgi:acetyltransferase-like isoleucine patch superfamily enzyme
MLNQIAILLRTAARRLRVCWWRWRGIDLPPTTRLDAGVDFARGIAQSRPGTIGAGPDCHFSQGVIVHAYGGRVTLGAHVYLGPYSVLYGHGGLEIGDHTLLSMHCSVLSSNHAIPPPGVAIRSQPDVLRPTKIGRDVWLGAGVTVLGGVTIGDGCIVGAGAVVAHDLPPEQRRRRRAGAGRTPTPVNLTAVLPLLHVP